MSRQSILMLGNPEGLAGMAGVALAAKGAGVAFCCENPGGGREVCLKAVEAGGSAMALGVDFGDASSIADAVGAVIDHWGRIDAVVIVGCARAAEAVCPEIQRRRGWGEARVVILAGGEQRILRDAARDAFAVQKRGRPVVYVLASGEPEIELAPGVEFISVSDDEEAVESISAVVCKGSEAL